MLRPGGWPAPAPQFVESILQTRWSSSQYKGRIPERISSGLASLVWR